MKLMESLKIKNVVLRNRIIMPPMDTNFATNEGSVTEKTLQYYEERANNDDRPNKG